MVNINEIQGKIIYDPRQCEQFCNHILVSVR